MGSGKSSLLSSVFLRFAIFFSLSLSLFLFSASSIGIKDDKALHFSLNDELGHDYTFPKGFKWGTATAAYQVEGAYDKDGRGPSIWDTFTHTPGKIRDSSTGDHADDHYNQMEQDVELMRNMGVHVYRFSLSWSRIFPKGEGEVNRKGVEFYNQLIDSLLKRGIEPFITLYHWDLPQALEDKYGGWLSNVTSKKFEDYAEFCFREFGDRVKYWLTLNEPHSFAVHGYVSGWHAPGRCSNRLICAAGNTSTEPYIVTHNALLAHAMAVDVYRKKFAPTQKGKIGITLDISNYEPYDPENPKDVEAVERAYAWHGAWFADPVYFGDYPKVMKERVGDRLPVFTEEEKKLIKGSSDFFGLNHYTSSYVIHQDEPTEEEGYYRDRGCLTTSERDGKLIGPRGEPTWLFVVPRGFRAVLNWVWKRYEKPDIYITENGVSAPHESLLSVEVALEDEFRVGYYRDYIKEMSKAINEDGVNVLGYMAWSLFDNFEWADGYEKRFGLFYVNYNSTKYERYPKKSAKWYSKLIAST